jgi:hypothetical protein
MMKQNNGYRYSGITSFKDFHFERERLKLKGKLMEAKMRLNVYNIRQALSVTNLIPSLIRDFGLTKISDTIEELFYKK